MRNEIYKLRGRGGLDGYIPPFYFQISNRFFLSFFWGGRRVGRWEGAGRFGVFILSLSLKTLLGGRGPVSRSRTGYKRAGFGVWGSGFGGF